MRYFFVVTIFTLGFFTIGCATKEELREFSTRSARNSTFQELCEYVRDPNPFDSKMVHSIYRNEWKRRHNFSKQVEEAILAEEANVFEQFGKIIPNMNKKAVLCARGKPSRKNITRTTTGTREQWVYEKWGLHVHFEDENVVSISETNRKI